MIEWMEGGLIFWDWKDIKKKPIHGFKSSHWNIFDCWVYMLGFLNELILSRHLLFGGEECEYAYVWPVRTRQIPISFTVLFLTVWPFSDTTDTNQLYSTVVIATYQTHHVGFVFGGQGLVTPVYSGRLVVKMTWAFPFLLSLFLSYLGVWSFIPAQNSGSLSCYRGLGPAGNYFSISGKRCSRGSVWSKARSKISFIEHYLHHFLLPFSTNDRLDSNIF